MVGRALAREPLLLLLLVTPRAAVLGEVVVAIAAPVDGRVEALRGLAAVVAVAGSVALVVLLWAWAGAVAAADRVGMVAAGVAAGVVATAAVATVLAAAAAGAADAVATDAFAADAVVVALGTALLAWLSRDGSEVVVD